MSKATIYINSLKIYAYHGVMPQERTLGNNYEIDCTLEYDCLEAMATDNLDATINYAEVVAIIEEEMRTPSKLLENVVWRIHRALKRRYPDLLGGSITLRKMVPPIPAQMHDAAFTFEW